ncbi:MAG: C40 family peptidase [Melioribacteraceae bacterium]|nr:C40 family peptidase [Melioribacteraceae bacterium]MCF8354701.1 C40 family peptidase [Melioribacteraceae bacterium]MCF8393603.1 C40 family peptidase [Melioribacteraceae bacterium]MCF8419413.1 C40 family peptidase [Melioribacteraceae bacterium]
MFKLYNKILIGVAAVIISSCSSSSYNTRYNKPPEKEDEPSSSVRFTSDENEDKHPRDISDEKKVFSDPGYSEFDDEPVEEYKVDVDRFVEKFDKLASLESALTTREKMLFEIIKYLDTPYQYGGETVNGIDCSAFTRAVFDSAIGEPLPRTASEQFEKGSRISSKESLEFGDLIFFNTTSRSYPGHVGIYIGDNLFAHASRSKGVIISSMKSEYYNKRFIGANRVKEIQ